MPFLFRTSDRCTRKSSKIFEKNQKAILFVFYLKWKYVEEEEERINCCRAHEPSFLSKNDCDTSNVCHIDLSVLHFYWCISMYRNKTRTASAGLQKKSAPTGETTGRSKIFSFSLSNRVSTVTINNNIIRARRGRLLWRACNGISLRDIRDLRRRDNYCLPPYKLGPLCEFVARSASSLSELWVESGRSAERSVSRRSVFAPSPSPLSPLLSLSHPSILSGCLQRLKTLHAM